MLAHNIMMIPCLYLVFFTICGETLKQKLNGSVLSYSLFFFFLFSLKKIWLF